MCQTHKHSATASGRILMDEFKQAAICKTFKM